MSLSSKEIDAAWNKLGMHTKATGDLHALLYVDGKLVLRTKRSLGSGKIEGNIPHLIRQQMKLNQDQFNDLIACPLTRDGYLKILRDKKII